MLLLNRFQLCQGKVSQACLILANLLELSKEFALHAATYFFVRPAKWKKYFELINTQKDASRTKAIEMFPKISSILAKKKKLK